ncbi:MAG TPA: tetratricopeptide repeat protein [Polyangiaceae bacterium]
MPSHAPPASSPPSRKSGKPPSRRQAPSIELRLAIGKTGLGIELGAPARLGCLQLTELAITLPAVRFPVDVSGGVQRFRHRRGVLERMTFETSPDAVTHEVAPRLRGLLGESTPQVWIGVRPWGATVGVSDDALGRALAFELAIDAFEDELRLVVFGARGLGLPQPAVALAARAVSTALGKIARRDGSRFVIEGAPAAVGRALLPDAGARAPECRGARFTAITCAADAWILHVSRGSAASPAPEAVRAREAAELLREADDALALGDLERARALDLYCLERAPRHPEVCRRIADLDRVVSGRAEAARAVLADASEPAFSSALAGELALESHDVTSALASLLRAAEDEIVPALAALALERAAQASADSIEALAWLDRAISRAPTSARLHWTRAAARIALGRLRDAVSDVEEIEAMTRGAGLKHEVWRRAASLWTAAGHAAEARVLFERALRFTPDDPKALAGLGSAMIAQGKVARGVALLSRALQQAERARLPASETSSHALALARALAEQLGDRPAAIARARTIGSAALEAIAARGLEGRWRAALGDKPGASLAYAQMRDLCAAHADGSRAGDEARSLLLEAATFERKTRGDLASAQAHLSVALRLFPRDLAVGAAYRDTSEALSGAPPRAFAESTDDETLADDLLRRYRASPTDDRIVDELANVLARLGRSHEVLALLAARYEDASPERRAKLAPLQIEVLARLERDARARGHDHEAQLFRDAIAQMGGAIEP